METLNHYRQIIQAFLQDMVAKDNAAQLIFDQERDRYLVIHNAWHNEARTYGCVMQLDLIDGKVWIQHNSTDIDIDQELHDRGIPKTDIVLGFRSPTVRSLLAQTTQT